MARIFLTHIPQMRRDYYGERALAGLRQHGDVVLNPGDTVLEGKALAEAARGCEIIVSDRMTPGPQKPNTKWESKTVHNPYTDWQAGPTQKPNTDWVGVHIHNPNTDWQAGPTQKPDPFVGGPVQTYGQKTARAVATVTPQPEICSPAMLQLRFCSR